MCVCVYVCVCVCVCVCVLYQVTITLFFYFQLHIVHYNAAHGSLAASLAHEDGLAVLGFFFTVICFIIL